MASYLGYRRLLRGHKIYYDKTIQVLKRYNCESMLSLNFSCIECAKLKSGLRYIINVLFYTKMRDRINLERKIMIDLHKSDFDGS